MNGVLAALLVVSTVTASVPFLFSQKADAVADTSYNVTVAPACVNGRVVVNVTGDNPTADAGWVRSSTYFNNSAPVPVAAHATGVKTQIVFDTASIDASAVTLWVSPTEQGDYQYIPSVFAPHAAFNCYDTVYVSADGNDANIGTTAASPFATIQKALDTVNPNGTVKVADGSYTGTARIKKSGTKLIGASGNRDAVTIFAVGNASGQAGIYADSLNDITIENLAVTAAAGTTFTNGGVIKLSNGTKGVIHNVVVKSADIITPGASMTNTTGININGFADVTIDNVFVAGMGHDGISIVGQQNSSVVTKNVTLRNITVSGRSTSWSGLAFDTKQASITGVTLQDVRLQYGARGLYVDGNNLTHTVTGVNGGILQLNNTLIKNITNEYINNEQTASINASGVLFDFQNRPVYVDTVAAKDLTAIELANLRTNYIKDKTNKNSLHLGYGTVFIQGPAAPTGLSPNGWTSSFTKFAWTAPADAATYNVRYSRIHPNEVVNAPVATTTDAAPEYSTTLADGPLFWQVQAVDAAGNAGPWSGMGYATIDAKAPTVSVSDFLGFTNAKSFDISGTVTDPYLKNYTYEVTDASGTVIAPVTKTTSVTNGTIGTIDISQLSEGSYTVVVTARDILGHETTETTVFTIDRTSPDILGGDVIRNGAVFTSQLINSADIKSYSWKADSSNPVDGVIFDGQLFNPEFTVTKYGEYSFTLTVLDAAGNKTARVVSFSYPAPTQTAEPAVTPATLVDGTVTTASATPATFSSVIGATATDAAVLGATDTAATSEPAAVKGATTDNTVAAIVNNNDGNVFGIAWFWWILILAALASVVYYITGAIRRRNADA